MGKAELDWPELAAPNKRHPGSTCLFAKEIQLVANDPVAGKVVRFLDVIAGCA